MSTSCLRPFLLVSCLQWILILTPLGVGSGGLDGISGLEGPGCYAVACRIAESGRVWDPGNVVDVDRTMDVRQAVPDVIDSRAVVALVGIDTAQMGEDAQMDCDIDCAERDILNEFETVDGMPVYYGGDLYDSDWEDPRDLAYADWVDWYNLNAPEGMVQISQIWRILDCPRLWMLW